jgi:hypothetical protein
MLIGKPNEVTITISLAVVVDKYFTKNIRSSVGHMNIYDIMS